MMKQYIEYKKLEEIKPYQQNPRKKINYDRVANSIREFGFNQPIVIDKHGVIIVGHSRYEASKILELEQVPVIVADLSPTKAKAYRIADNKTNEYSEWDYGLLQKEFTDLLDINYDLNNLGFEESALEDLITHSKEMLPDSYNKETVADRIDNFIVQYNIIFDNTDQQEIWFKFLKALKEKHPEQETIGERLTNFLERLDYGKS